MGANANHAIRRHLLLIAAIVTAILLNLAPMVLAGMDLAAAGGLTRVEAGTSVNHQP
jgi:hypothetical protein